MTKRQSGDPNEEFSITLPDSPRWESRVLPGHTSSQWKFKLQEYGYRCAYCGIHARATDEGYLTRDHIVPIIDGGDDDIENIVPACWNCNQRKGPRRPGEEDVPTHRVRKRKRPW